MRTPFTMSPSNVSIQLNHFLNSNLLLIVTLVFLLAPSAAKANWWYLGLSGVQSSAAGSNHRSLSDIKSSSFDLNPNNWPLPDSNRLQPPPAPAPTSSFYTLPSQKDAVKVILQEDAFVDRPTARRLCRRLPGLNDAQLKLCESNPSLMTAVTQGAKLGLSECQLQFQHERWNCTAEGDQHVFGRTLQRGSRETAFVHAITSAGVVFAITQRCSSGQLGDCGCDAKYAVSSLMKPTPQLIQALEEQQTLEGPIGGGGGDGLMSTPATSRTQWRWGGCSDNVRFGVAFARRFVDAPEVTNSHRSIRAVMNLHNNKAGREAIKRRMRLRCRCHGVSGSCELKTCWRTLPEFDLIGADLKGKYEQSVPISGLVGRRSIASRRRRQGRGGSGKAEGAMALVSSIDQRRPTKEDLVHISKSPNYCVPDPNNGVLGTNGRRCERNSNGADSCDLLCCGRGYHTRMTRQRQQCNCKFEWCCHVTCQSCEQLVPVHTCK